MFMSLQWGQLQSHKSTKLMGGHWRHPNRLSLHNVNFGLETRWQVIIQCKKKLMGNIHLHDQYLTIIVGNLGLLQL